MKQMALFSTKPEVAKGLTRAEADQINTYLANHFKVAKPAIKWSATRRGKYSVMHQTIIIGHNSWRGKHTMVHEFAHHLDMVRRGHAGKWMPKPTRVRNVYIGGGAFAQLPSSGRREFHGESFTKALEDCVDAVFGCQHLYSWETEYKSVKANHAKRYAHIANAVTPGEVIGRPGWLVWRPKPQPQPTQPTQWSLPMAAEPKLTVTPPAQVVINKAATAIKLRKVANAAWAAPSAENNWQGGCLWRKFKGGK
jgi:hypothetical protein